MAGSFEAKKHGYRQTQDGVVVSFVLHPNDLDAAFAVAPLGTRYMIGFAEIGEDEKPIAPVAQRSEPAAHNGSVEGSNPSGTTKTRTPFNELKLSQQAGIRCGDELFQQFMVERYAGPHAYRATADNAATTVRELCNITSRSELDFSDMAGNIWKRTEQDYQQWVTDQRYKDIRR